MDTAQIYCTLRNLSLFLGVFPSDLLPPTIATSGNIIINTDPHTECRSQWPAIYFQTKFHSAFYFDSYVLFLSIPENKAFLRSSCVDRYGA
jgi:hypothetical protein